MKDTKCDHIVALLPIFNTILYLQIFLSVCILGLSAYGISVVVDLPGASLAIFVSLATIIIRVWFLVSSKKAHSLYNAIVVLIVECLLFIWWLATWAELLEWTVAYAYSDGCYVGRCLKKRTIFSWDSYRDSVAAATGASILNFMLVVVTLVIYSRAFHRHRKSGAPWASFGKWSNGELNGSGAGGPRLPRPGAAQQPQSQLQSEVKNEVVQSVQAVPSQYGNAPPQPPMQGGPVRMQTPTGTPTPVYQQPGFPSPGAPMSPQPMMLQQPMPGQPQMVSRPATMIAQPMAQQMPQGQFIPQQQPQMFAPGTPIMMMRPGQQMGQQYQMMPQQQQQFAPRPPQMMGSSPPPPQGYWQPQGQAHMMPQQQQMYQPQMAFAQPPPMQHVPVRQVSPVPTPPPGHHGAMQPPGMAAPRGPPSPFHGNVAMVEPPSPIQHPATAELPATGQLQ